MGESPNDFFEAGDFNKRNIDGPRVKVFSNVFDYPQSCA